MGSEMCIRDRLKPTCSYARAANVPLDLGCRSPVLWQAGPYVQIALEKAGPSCKAALETARAQLLSLTASMSQGARAGKEKAKTL